MPTLIKRKDYASLPRTNAQEVRIVNEQTQQDSDSILVSLGCGDTWSYLNNQMGAPSGSGMQVMRLKYQTHSPASRYVGLTVQVTLRRIKKV